MYLSEQSENRSKLTNSKWKTWVPHFLINEEFQIQMKWAKIVTAKLIAKNGRDTQSDASMEQYDWLAAAPHKTENGWMKKALWNW